jgi:hypothetical protein
MREPAAAVVLHAPARRDLPFRCGAAKASACHPPASTYVNLMQGLPLHVFLPSL